MAFQNQSLALTSLAPSTTTVSGAPGTHNTGRSTLGLLHDVEAARAGILITNVGGQANVAAGQYTYRLSGCNYFSIVLYGTIGGASITLWGSQSNNPGSWVPIGTAITATGETIITGKFYQYVSLSVDTASSGNLSIDIAAYRI